MEIPSVPDFYQPLSLKLCKILDDIGASEDFRKLSIEAAVTLDIVQSSIYKDENQSLYLFGSRAEGTTTSGLDSDIDSLRCHDLPEIVQCISEIPLQQDQPDNLLMVRDKNTKPGYCKLQLVKSGTPITRSHIHLQLLGVFKFDCHDRLVRTAVRSDTVYSSPYGGEYTVHGPAMSLQATSARLGHDIVGAYRCRSWPNAASEWSARKRIYGWPSQELIERMKTFGFFVVGVGHRHSSERDLEWRISLSLQERLLMFSLNPTQFKCYILLKMIKKYEINKKLGEEVLTSYHCKTCLFYMIENTPSDMWQPQNLLACLQGCLKCIYRCAKTGNCPNYFIPEENMFEGRMDDEMRIKLENICKVLLIADCSFLIGLHCDGIAKWIKNSIFPGTVISAIGMRLAPYRERIANGPFASMVMLSNVSSSSRSEAIKKMFPCIYDLSHAISFTERMPDQMRHSACIALPYLEISLISVIIADAVELGKAETAVNLLLSSKWEELSNRSDSFSAKLKQATFLYMLGQYGACQKVLTPILNCWLLPLQISYCFCRQQEFFLPVVLCSAEKGMSFDKFRTSHYAPCIIFSSLEGKLLPTALAYEMLRSVHMPSGAWDYCANGFKPDWAVVDGRIFLYFLIFLLSQAKDTTDTGKAISYMELLLEKDKNLSHRETAMNLIGWCYKQEGNISEAVEYFFKSLTLEKSHNAAFWHLLFTISEIISGRDK